MLLLPCGWQQAQLCSLQRRLHPWELRIRRHDAASMRVVWHAPALRTTLDAMQPPGWWLTCPTHQPLLALMCQLIDLFMMSCLLCCSLFR